MAKKTNWASAEHNTQDSSVVAGAQKSSLNQEQWSEDFQDLSVYCNIGSKMVDNSALQSGEQLNTPNISVQDGFDFGLRSSSGERLETLEDPDPWEALRPQSSPQSNTKLWGSVSDWLMTSPNPGVDHEPPFDIIVEPEGKSPPIASDEDCLQSESPSEYDAKTPFTTDGQEYNEQSIDIVTFDAESPNNNNSAKHSSLIFSTNLGSNSTIIIKQIENNNNYSSNNNHRNYPVKSMPQPLVLRTQQRTEDVHGYNKNRRDPVNNTQLSSIFKSDEPILVEQDKQLSSSFCHTSDYSGGGKVIRRTPAVIVMPKEVPDEELLQATVNRQLGQLGDTLSGKQPKFILPHIKMELMDDSEEMECFSVEDEQPDTVMNNGKVFKIPDNQMRKPSLKLDIDSAASHNAALNLNPSSALAESLDTPDMLRPLLSNSGGFDLLKYFEGGEEVASNLLCSGTDSPVDVKRSNIVFKKETSSPGRGEKVFPEEDEPKNELPTIKEEEEEEYDYKRMSCSSSGSVPKRKRRKSMKKGSGKRRSTVLTSEEVDSDYNPPSEDCNDDEEEDDETFQPPSSLKQPKRKRTISKSSSPSVSSRRKVSSSEVDSDQESIGSSVDRYRELRDRNNEASRRSRMNRKSREQEMKSMAHELEANNRALKEKAENMERLVKKLRAGLMQLVLQNRN